MAQPTTGKASPFGRMNTITGISHALYVTCHPQRWSNPWVDSGRLYIGPLELDIGFALVPSLVFRSKPFCKKRVRQKTHRSAELHQRPHVTCWRFIATKIMQSTFLAHVEWSKLEMQVHMAVRVMSKWALTAKQLQRAPTCVLIADVCVKFVLQMQERVSKNGDFTLRGHRSAQ